MKTYKAKKIRFPRVGQIRTYKGLMGKPYDIALTRPLMNSITKEHRWNQYRYKRTPIKVRIIARYNYFLYLLKR